MFGLSYAHRQIVSLQEIKANGAYPTSRALLVHDLGTGDGLLPDPVVVCTSTIMVLWTIVSSSKFETVQLANRSP